MAYGTLKVDTITFTNGGADQSITVSGIVQSISGDITATGTISGDVIQGGTLVSGATVTGTAGQFGTLTGNTAGFTTVTGATVTGGVGSFTTLTGGVTTMTSGVFATGSATNPSISFTSDPNTGIYSPGADQVAISTSGTGRLFIDSSGRLGLGTSSPRGIIDAIGTCYLGSATSGSRSLFVNEDANGAMQVVSDSTSFGLALESAYSSGYIKFRIAGIDRMHLDSSGRLGIGTTGPGSALEIDAAAATSPFIAKINTAEAARIDSSGRLLVGTSSARSSFYNNVGFAPPVQIEGVGSAGAYLSIVSNKNAGGDEAGFIFGRTRGTAVGSNTVVASGDILGRISFQGADGSDLIEGGAIQCEVDGTPGANDMPGRLMFFTTADAASSPTERMRIDSSGRLLVGTSTARSNLYGAAAYSALFQVEGAANDIGQRSFAFTYNNNNAASPVIALSKTRGTTVGSNTIVQSGDELGSISFQGADGSNLVTSAQIIAYVDGTPGANDMPGRLVFFTTADGASTPTERMRIDSSGRLLVGTSTATNNIRNGQKLAVTTTETSNNGGISLTNYGGTDPNYAPVLDLQRSRGTTDGSFTEVVSGDRLGYIIFRGADGVGWSDAATIFSEADGDWTTSGDTTDSPGRLVFATTPDASASPTERMRIDSSGRVGIGTTAPYARLDCVALSNGTPSLGSATYYSQVWQNTVGGYGLGVNVNAATGIALIQSQTFTGTVAAYDIALNPLGGRVGIGTTSPQAILHVAAAVGAGVDAGCRFQDTTNNKLIQLMRTGSGYNYIGIGAVEGVVYSENTLTLAADGSSPIKFCSGSERARIDSSGRLLVGTSSTSIVSTAVFQGSSGGAEPGIIRLTSTSSSPADGADLGAIAFGDSGHGSGVSINAQRDGGTWTSGSSQPTRLLFYTTADGSANPTERMRIDSSGRVGIGTTSADTTFHVEGDAGRFSGTKTAGSFLDIAPSNTGSDGVNLSVSYYGSGSYGPLKFSTSSSESARIDSSGRLLIGTSSALNSDSIIEGYKASGNTYLWVQSNSLGNDQSVRGIFVSGGRSGQVGAYKHSGITNPAGFIFTQREDGSDAWLWTDNPGDFRISNLATNIGTTGGTVVGTQTSDGRLKNILGTVEYGLETVKQFETVRYSLKARPEVEKIGFIAQQILPLVPESVFDTNEPIEGEPEDAPTKLGMEYVALIPVLVNAIKELSAEVDGLKAQLQAQ